MRLNDAEAVENLAFDEVVAKLTDVRQQIKAYGEVEYLLSRRVIEVMQAEGSERMRTPTGIVTIPRSVTYDASVLAGLREITDPVDLAGIYTPEHEEIRQVPERWDMSKGRQLGKHSGDHAAIIENARIYGRARVKIEEAIRGS